MINSVKSAHEPATKRRRWPRERGQSVVEFAIIPPFLAVLVLGLAEFGLALRSHMVTVNAAREGARIGAIGASSADIEAKTVDASGGLLTAADITVSNAGGATGTSVTVEATYNHSYVTPFGALLSTITGHAIPNPLPMTSTTKMRIQ